MHRYIYAQRFGKIPDGICVRHKCDNPSCINIEHLELGTHQENMDDMVNRKRSLKGSNNALSKLDEDKIRMIRLSSKNNSELERELGVSNQLISLIRKGKLWQHVV